jgi:hypothetical protein
MVDGGVDRVESIGGVEGWHLEPLLRAPADSLSAPDSLATPVPADTLAAPLPPMAWGPIEHRGGDVAPPGAYLFPMPSTRRQRLP